MSAIPQTEAEVLPFLRRLIYDVSVDGCQACEVMGMPSASHDVCELEHRASNERLTKISSLIPFIGFLSYWLAGLSVEQLVATGQADGWGDTEKSVMLRLFDTAITPAVVGIIAGLVETGALHVNQ